ncbi:hypothetical protein KS4_35720 [Poriferisphaera corsica]|uniref:PEP-CTERM sorting domain-containing protein n=1 Tax=Poriferisphaera corsica TaxID=2528020 RepID=A0A517YZ73_9BACT|nr:choice-of-anchor K domain-containing protein [Poriferisphaera corsica]QDU35489.1 hypothetical protein KS4_35720 [Poriferisphaera corsica]
MAFARIHKKRFFAFIATLIIGVPIFITSNASAAMFTGRVSTNTISINDDLNPDATYKEEYNNRLIRLGQNPSPGYTIEDTLQTLAGYNPIETDASEAFSVGGITHWNGKTVADTAPDSIAYNVNLNFSGDNASLGPQTFTFNLDFNAGAEGESDVYSIPDTAISDQTFTYNGVTYALQLLGFGNNPNAINADFITGGLYSNSNSNILAQFVEIPATVPTPAAGTLALASLAALALKRNRNTRTKRTT